MLTCPYVLHVPSHHGQRELIYLQLTQDEWNTLIAVIKMFAYKL